MKKLILTLLLLIPVFTFAQDIVGKWKTIDDETGKAKSIVEIYQVNGKYFGKIVKILTVGEENKLCTECKGADKNKPMLGMVILKGLVKDGDEWNAGEIFDPNKGKSYKCYIAFEGKDKLKVRGFIGFSLIGRTQYWHKAD